MRSRISRRLIAGTGLALLAFTTWGRASDSVDMLIDATRSAAISPVTETAPASAPTPLAAPAAVAVPAPTAKPVVASVSDKPTDVDLAAIYYYAEQHQDERVEREATRLRQKYPGFQLPTDLYVPAARRGADESNLWVLYKASDFTGIDAEIVRRKTADPSWTPTPDFTAKLSDKKRQVAITEAARMKNWTGVLQASAGLDPDKTDDAQMLWDVIDADSALGKVDAAAPFYRSILFRKDAAFKTDVIVATLEKALRDFPAADVRKVIDQLSARTDLVSAMPKLSADLMRKEVAEFNASAVDGAALPAADIATLEEAAADKADIADHSLLGWYYLKVKANAKAEPWFRAAMQTTPDIDNAKGLYLSLAGQGKDADAFALVSGSLETLADDPAFLLNALSVRFSKPELGPIDAKMASAYASAIQEEHAADHAEILGWYAYNSRQFEASEAWFDKAWNWEKSPARLKGLALSYVREDKKAELAALKQAEADTYPQVWDEIKIARPPKGIAGASVSEPKASVEASYLKNFSAKRYGACVDDINRLEARGNRDAEVQRIKGWCSLNLDRLAQARDAFTNAVKGSSQTREDAAYGLALTFLKGNLTDEAETVVNFYTLSQAHEREIKSDIYSQRALAAFDAKQYQRALDALNTRATLVAETADLSQMRGWAYYFLGDKTQANAVFSRLDMHMSGTNARRGLDATSLNN